MLNVERTKEYFGYEVSLKSIRRSKEDIERTNGIQPKKLKVIDNCPSCNKERIITLRASRLNKPCSKCFHTSAEMMEIKKNNHYERSEETKQKMKENHWSKRGFISPFSGKHHSEINKKILSDKTATFLASLSEEEKLQRAIKSSSTLRGISTDDWDGFITEENSRIRGSKEYKDWETKVVTRDKRCCFPGCLERRKKELTAHHLDGFSWCVDRRFDVTNGALLCHYHHKTGPEAFHRIYSTHKNTEAQYREWISANSLPQQKEKHLYVIAGAHGAGKSWVCNQLADYCRYISYDEVPKELHIQQILSSRSDLPILYDPIRKASSFIKRYGDVFTIHLIVIVETADVIKQRLLSRNSKHFDKAEKYAIKAGRAAKNAEFSGTSSEVLEYLRNKLSSV